VRARRHLRKECRRNASGVRPIRHQFIRPVSDLFYLALFTSSTALALRAAVTGSKPLWLGAGILIGSALLTRTNAITLLLLGLVPFSAPASARSRCADFAWLATGLALPLAIFAVYAAATGSNLVPRYTYANLAAGYFPEGKDRQSSFDAVAAAAKRFDSMHQVLLYDPMRIVTTYVDDIKQLLLFQVQKLLTTPLNLLYLPGLFLLFSRHTTRLMSIFALVILAQLLLVNLMPFQPRFYLFLVPLLGAGIGEFGWRLLQSTAPSFTRHLLVVILVACSLFAGATAFSDARQNLLMQAEHTRELTQVLPAARKVISPDSLIVSRKPHLAFYLNMPYFRFPEVKTFSNLRTQLHKIATQGQVYIFYGRMEQYYRPQFRDLLDPAARPGWIEAVAESMPARNWALLSYTNE
jgi:hypothetical protein